MAVTKRKIVNAAKRGIKGSAFCFVALASYQASAHPTEISACTTITKPGSYILAQDIAYSGATDGACITIMVSRVSINLDGHTISWLGPHGLGQQPTAIVSANDTEHVIVQNGTISGFGDSVKLLGSGSTVKDVHVGGPCPCNGTGIEADGVVKDNVVSIASAPGGSIGIQAQGIIQGNYIYNTRSFGMVVEASSTARGNTITGTIDGDGMFVYCPSTIAHNTVEGSGRQNIVLNGDGCTLRDNTAP